MTDMGTFRTDVELENAARPGERVRLGGVLVDTGAELSWFPSATLEALGIERRKRDLTPSVAEYVARISVDEKPGAT